MHILGHHSMRLRVMSSFVAALLLAPALSLAYPGPMDFNCTTPPLSVVYGAPLGQSHACHFTVMLHHTTDIYHPQLHSLEVPWVGVPFASRTHRARAELE
jgi:hypothetical protein